MGELNNSLLFIQLTSIQGNGNNDKSQYSFGLLGR